MLGQSVNYRRDTSCLVDGTCNQDGILLKKELFSIQMLILTYNDLSNNKVWALIFLILKELNLMIDCNQIKQKNFKNARYIQNLGILVGNKARFLLKN